MLHNICIQNIYIVIVFVDILVLSIDYMSYIVRHIQFNIYLKKEVKYQDIELKKYIKSSYRKKDTNIDLLI